MRPKTNPDEITAAQCRAARALLNISQDELPARSKVAKTVIGYFERSHRLPYPRALNELRFTLEAMAVEFIAEDERGAGVRMRDIANADFSQVRS